MKLKAILALAAAAMLLAGPLYADKKEKKDALAGIKCPVSGKAVVDCTAEYKGAKVYFCCGKCRAAFTKDATKFTAKANQQLYATKQAKLVKCVFTGKKLNGETAIDVGGTKVCFCCAGCKKKAESQKDIVACVFGEKQFAKGFEVVAAKKKEEK